MLTRRTRAVAAVLEGHLYVIGGNDGDLALSSGERSYYIEGTVLAPIQMSVSIKGGDVLISYYIIHYSIIISLLYVF